MKTIALRPHFIKASGLFCLLLLALSACTAPRLTEPLAVYDFGPGNPPMALSAGSARRPALILPDPQTSAVLNGNAVLYRLGYADAQQVRPYALARWGSPPAQLVGQRLRQQLSQHRAVLATGELLPANSPQLQLELEEFSHWFDRPNDSHGLVRWRATLTQRSAGGDRVLAQRNFVQRQPALTPDATGGVRALSAAVDALALELEAWLAQSEAPR